MSRNVANEQAIFWLYSMMNDPDSFNAINAGNCLALIENQKTRLRLLGSYISKVIGQRDNLRKEKEELERFYAGADGVIMKTCKACEKARTDVKEGDICEESTLFERCDLSEFAHGDARTWLNQESVGR